MNNAQLALHHARPFVENRDFYLCVALDKVAANHLDLADAAMRVQRHIQRSLHGHHTLGIWLTYQGIDTVRDNHETTGVLARLAWIDKLMESFA